MGRVVTLFVILTVCCIAAVEVLYRHLAGGPVQVAERPEERGGAIAVEQTTPDRTTGSTTDAAVIVSRNLFAPGTADSREESRLLADLSAAVPDLVLMGTVTGADKEQRAIIYDTKEQRQHLCRLEDLIGQAVVREIRRGQVVIVRNGREQTLDITQARTVRAQHRDTGVLSGGGTGAGQSDEGQDMLPQQAPATPDQAPDAPATPRSIPVHR